MSPGERLRSAPSTRRTGSALSVAPSSGRRVVPPIPPWWIATSGTSSESRAHQRSPPLRLPAHRLVHLLDRRDQRTQVRRAHLVRRPGFRGPDPAAARPGLCHRVAEQRPISAKQPVRQTTGTFNRLSGFEVEPEKVRCLVNGHLYYETDRNASTSPWLALYSGVQSQPVYRNPKLAGTPQIPSEVRLTHSDRLEGWYPGLSFDTRPANPYLAAGQPETERAATRGDVGTATATAFDWSAGDGVIHGRRLDEAPEQPRARARVCSPITGRSAKRESIAYEFFYEPGRTEVHPAVSTGSRSCSSLVRCHHWMTLDNGVNGLGLKDDNAARMSRLPSRSQPVALEGRRLERFADRPGAWEGHTRARRRGHLRASAREDEQPPVRPLSRQGPDRRPGA